MLWRCAVTIDSASRYRRENVFWSMSRARSTAASFPPHPIDAMYIHADSHDSAGTAIRHPAIPSNHFAPRGIDQYALLPRIALSRSGGAKVSGRASVQ